MASWVFKSIPQRRGQSWPGAASWTSSGALGSKDLKCFQNVSSSTTSKEDIIGTEQNK
jgi:hypothetical protein